MKDMWNKVKKITGSKSNTNNKITPSEWRRHFDSVFNVNPGTIKKEWEVDLDALEVQADDSLDGDITEQEVQLSIRKAKDGKACGIDRLPIEIWKYGSSALSVLLAMLFTCIIRLGRFPVLWTKSLIHPIFKKKGSPNDANMYRGVALLCHSGKILTRILCSRLKEFVKRRKILREEQAGFRAGYSTIDNCFVLDALVNKYVKNKRKGKLFCAFLDFKKAFDCVPRVALYKKLAKYCISAKFIRLLQSMYGQASFAIKFSTHQRTDFIPSTSGVLQGCQLSPLLFSLYINDFCEYIDSDDSHPPELEGRSINSLLFADDVILLSSTKLGLQRSLNRAAKYCEDWGMTISIEKSKVMVFRKGGRLNRNDRWRIGNQCLEVVDKFRYLGLVFSSTGKWVNHFKCTKVSAKKALAGLRKLTGKLGGIPLKLGLHLFESLVTPILLYGSELFGFKVHDALSSLPNQFYRHLLRIPPGSASAGLYMCLDKPTINSLAIERAVGYWLKLLKMPEDRLPKIAYKYQCRLADLGKPSWVSDLRGIRDRTGFSIIWRNGGPVHSKPFLKMFKTRLRDIEFSQLRNQASELSSLRHLLVIKKQKGLEGSLNTNVIESRRVAGMLLLNAPGKLITRNENERICSCCREKLSCNIFAHLFSVCEKLNEVREKVDASRFSDSILHCDSSLTIVLKILFRSSEMYSQSMRRKATGIIMEALKLVDNDQD